MEGRCYRGNAGARDKQRVRADRETANTGERVAEFPKSSGGSKMRGGQEPVMFALQSPCSAEAATLLARAQFLNDVMQASFEKYGSSMGHRVALKGLWAWKKV